MKAGVATVLQSKINHVNVMEAFPTSCFSLCDDENLGDQQHSKCET